MTRIDKTGKEKKNMVYVVVPKQLSSYFWDSQVAEIVSVDRTGWIWSFVGPYLCLYGVVTGTRRTSTNNPRLLLFFALIGVVFRLLKQIRISGFFGSNVGAPVT